MGPCALLYTIIGDATLFAIHNICIGKKKKKISYACLMR